MGVLIFMAFSGACFETSLRKSAPKCKGHLRTHPLTIVVNVHNRVM